MKHKYYATAELPLHYGSAPKWLFERQKRIIFEILRLVIMEFGSAHLIERLSDPVWFQILGCISGFDWHSSGVTTTVTAAIKEAFNNKKEYGLFVFGGKGKAALNTPNEILQSEDITTPEFFITISRLTAKVDNSCIQDGYQIYHHTIFIDKHGNWAVVQQGMNTNTRYARRYHWANVITKSADDKTIITPHTGIIAVRKEESVLNFVDENQDKPQKSIIEYITSENAENIIREFRSIINSKDFADRKFILPQRHYISLEDYDYTRLYKIICKLKSTQLNSFKDILLTREVGPKTLRALWLICEAVYNYPVSTQDPARFSFAFGGKDGHPYPVDVKTYDETIEFFKYLVDKAAIEGKEKLKILKNFYLMKYLP